MSDDAVLARVSRYLESIEDVTLLLLKSHLLVEQQINSALHKIFPGFASLDTGRLTYHQRIQVIRALDGTRKAEDALRFAERLNLVRNHRVYMHDTAFTCDSYECQVETLVM